MKKLTDEKIVDNAGLLQYQEDKQKIDDFLNGETKTFDYQSFARLMINDLNVNDWFIENKILGFRRCDIVQMVEFPERNRKRILKLSDYMYLKSGYYKRLIDYFVNQTMINFTVDSKIHSIDAYKKPDLFKRNFIKFCHQADKFNLKNVGHDIFKRLYKNDVCFAFVEEDDLSCKYFFLDPMICEISQIVDGKVYEFYIKARMIPKSKLATFPETLQQLIEADVDGDGKIKIPYANSLCLKYNSDFIFAYPPFLMMIADILLIDDFKDLAKTQSLNDAYKLLTMKIPTKDGQITLDDGLIAVFVKQVLSVVQKNLGVITTPFETDTEEFSSSNSDNRDNVSNAISWAFKDVGVSEALMSGATSGSELKLSITNDSGDVFRLYRQIENWVALQMVLRKFVYGGKYEFNYKILNMTTFNEQEVRDQALKEAQNGSPNKFEWEATRGRSPCSVLGNSFVENDLFADLFTNWKPLQTSYTQSGSEEAGRPEMSDTEITERGEATRDSDANNPDNRLN